jgi:hypothetical protein
MNKEIANRKIVRCSKKYQIKTQGRYLDKVVYKRFSIINNWKYTSNCEELQPLWGSVSREAAWRCVRTELKLLLHVNKSDEWSLEFVFKYTQPMFFSCFALTLLASLHHVLIYALSYSV